MCVCEGHAIASMCVLCEEPPGQRGLALPEPHHSGDGGKRSRNLSLALATKVKNPKIA